MKTQANVDELARMAHTLAQIGSGYISDGNAVAGILGAYHRQLQGYGVTAADASKFLSPLASGAVANLYDASGQNRWYTRGDRLQGSGSILASTFSFGGTDYFGLTDSSQYQGDVFLGARIAANISREAGITALKRKRGREGSVEKHHLFGTCPVAHLALIGYHHGHVDHQ